MVRLLLAGLAAVWLALLGGRVLAQTAAPDLLVTLHDAAGTPVPGATVQISNADGSLSLAQAQTDADGTASFTGLAERQVRVAIRGMLPDGTALKQPGDDAAGIRMLLEPRPATLALLSGPDGRITPDPAAMARELDGPLLSPARLTPTPAGTPRFPPVHSRALAIGLFAFALLIGIAIGMVVMQRRSE